MGDARQGVQHALAVAPRQAQDVAQMQAQRRLPRAGEFLDPPVARDQRDIGLLVPQVAPFAQARAREQALLEEIEKLKNGS